MSLKTQAKILRVLQEQQFQRVGGSRVLKVDVRVIAATNKDLASEIKKGTFREDLYYRLNVVPIEVPSLRERKDDIPLLADHFLDDCAIQNRSRRKHIDPEALALLAAYPWPGNVRELKNLIERLVILVPGERITPDDIPISYRTNDLPATAIETDCLSIDDFKEAKKAFEEAYLRDKLRENDGNVSQTARRIGVGRSYLHKKLKQFHH
jgi:two-component system nitrogen regulation response regulator NtrX